MFVESGTSGDRDRSIPFPLDILDGLCLCLFYPPRASLGLSDLGGYKDQLSGYRQSPTFCLWSQAVFYLPRSLSWKGRKAGRAACHPYFTGQDDEGNCLLPSLVWSIHVACEVD